MEGEWKGAIFLCLSSERVVRKRRIDSDPLMLPLRSSRLMGLPPGETVEIAEYFCTVDSKADLLEYARGILGDNQGVAQFIKEFWRRKQSLSGRGAVDGKAGGRVGPAANEPTIASTTSRRRAGSPRGSRLRLSGSRGRGGRDAQPGHGGLGLWDVNGMPVEDGLSAKELLEKNRSVTVKVSKKTRKSRKRGGVGGAGASTKPRVRRECECQATRHPLWGNCTVCGRVICEEEGEGECHFCGSMVTKTGTKTGTKTRTTPNPLFIRKLSNGLIDTQVPSDVKGLESAIQRRETMLAFSQEESRTRIVDDQGDYFDHGNLWMDAEERAVATEIKKLREDEEDSRFKTRVTLDLVRRKVLEDNSDYYTLSNSQLRDAKAKEILNRKRAEDPRNRVRRRRHGKPLDRDERATEEAFARPGVLENATLKGRAHEVYLHLRKAVKELREQQQQQSTQDQAAGQRSQKRGRASGLSKILQHDEYGQGSSERDSGNDLGGNGPGGRDSVEKKRPAKRRPAPSAKWYEKSAEFTDKKDKGVCLSMHQPWASLLVLGIKRFEGRTWSTRYRGRLWIASAAREPTDEEIAAVEQQYVDNYGGRRSAIPFPKAYPTQALLGTVDLVDCLPQDDFQRYRAKNASDLVENSESQHLFVCQNPHQAVLPQRAKGGHKLWNLDPAIVSVMQKGLEPVSQAWLNDARKS